MTDPLGDEHRTGGVRRRVRGVARSIRVDLGRLHAVWMRLLFDTALRDDYSVVEGWQPGSNRERLSMWLWQALGVVPIAVTYPVSVLGVATRYYAHRLDRWTASLGLAGVTLVSMVAWAMLTVLTYLSPIAVEGLIAVAIAGVVATVSAVLAFLVNRHGGRGVRLALGYPLGVTALFLPPVVASLYSPTLASVVFPRSTSLAIVLLDTVLQVGGLAGFIRATFELEGVAYVAMWFGLAFPVGWLIGGIVSLGNVIRPAESRSFPPMDEA